MIGKTCENCNYSDTDMNEWPCYMCDDNGYGPSEWEVKDDDKIDECVFCQALKCKKDVFTGRRKFSIHLVLDMYKENGKHSGMYIEPGFELNYCPVCGKEIPKDD